MVGFYCTCTELSDWIATVKFRQNGTIMYILFSPLKVTYLETLTMQRREFKGMYDLG